VDSEHFSRDIFIMFHLLLKFSQLMNIRLTLKYFKTSMLLSPSGIRNAYIVPIIQDATDTQMCVTLLYHIQVSKTRMTPMLRPKNDHKTEHY
jgi:hypothetical protein